MIQCIRTDSTNEDFIKLVKELDADLNIRDGVEHSFYNQFNKIDAIKHAIVAYDKESAVGCGAIKEFDPISMEVKRMYVLPDRRGEGIASVVLQELEVWAGQLGCTRCLLETGKRQPEAISLYLKNGYQIIENFGPYKGVDNSVCFEKVLKAVAIHS